MQRLPQTSTHSLCLPTGEPSLSRESGGVGPRCACFPALNWTAETRAAAGGTAVTDIPHYCCCKCQSTTRNQSRLHWTHGQTQIYFMGRGVNRCVSLAMVCGGEGFSFLLMWQQVFFPKFATSDGLTYTSANFLQIHYCPSRKLPASFPPQELGDIYSIPPASYFLHKRQNLAHGDYLTANGSLSALRKQGSAWLHKRRHGGGERNIFSDICHKWSNWSFTVTGSWSTPSPADRVNNSSSCHYKLLSQPFKLCWTTVFGKL